MEKLRRGHIKILSALFEEDDYKFDWDGTRLKVLTVSQHVKPNNNGEKYINIIDNVSTGYTKASICTSNTIAEALKLKHPHAYDDLMTKLDRSKAQKSGRNDFVLLLKPDYDLELVKKIIDSIKTDYRKKHPKKTSCQTSKKRAKESFSALGRTLNKSSVERS